MAYVSSLLIYFQVLGAHQTDSKPQQHAMKIWQSSLIGTNYECRHYATYWTLFIYSLFKFNKTNHFADTNKFQTQNTLMQKYVRMLWSWDTGVTFGGGGQVENAPPIFFTPEEYFGLLRWRGANKIIWARLEKRTVCTYVRVCVCMCVCVSIYIYIYIYI